ncbi:MAG: hypothetical protein R3F41_06940 [Gammaproteobacteria bacterium]|nr:hypothetical protein [Pseudomonadales bacterium]
MDPMEIAEITALGMGNFLTTFSVFLSVASAYLVAAYLVGAKLTSLQLTIVNGSYLIATSILGYLVGANFRVFFVWASSNPDGLVRQSGRGPVLIDFTWPMSILMLVIIAGSMTFMVSIRKGGPGDSGT